MHAMDPAEASTGSAGGAKELTSAEAAAKMNDRTSDRGRARLAGSAAQSLLNRTSPRKSR